MMNKVFEHPTKSHRCKGRPGKTPLYHLHASKRLQFHQGTKRFVLASYHRSIPGQLCIQVLYAYLPFVLFLWFRLCPEPNRRILGVSKQGYLQAISSFPSNIWFEICKLSAKYHRFVGVQRKSLALRAILNVVLNKHGKATLACGQTRQHLEEMVLHSLPSLLFTGQKKVHGNWSQPPAGYAAPQAIENTSLGPWRK